MLEKGKGRYVEHLRIIQLCEADLSFLLHVIWGNKMIRSALHNKVLEDSQFTLPGMTCNSAVWNKTLYLDLLHQTLTSGIMRDYDATAAFDRALHSISVLTSRQLGMPQHASIFLYNLLQNMEFTLLTGFGESSMAFKNNEGPLQTGQGMIQGSSSAAPM